jgi:hypothetical protein
MRCWKRPCSTSWPCAFRTTMWSAYDQRFAACVTRTTVTLCLRNSPSRPKSRIITRSSVVGSRPLKQSSKSNRFFFEYTARAKACKGDEYLLIVVEIASNLPAVASGLQTDWYQQNPLACALPVASPRHRRPGSKHTIPLHTNAFHT